MAPSISVVIPVYNGAAHIETCLTALSRTETAPLECIVVDDGSTDSSREIAHRFGAKVLSTNGRCGPAFARNLGAKEAKGQIILFLDSDVCVYPDTISKVADEFAWHPDVDAVMGSYDNAPSAKNFVSQYRNLMHCFVHQHSNRDAKTFWAGCGAIRRSVFLEFGGFDEQHFHSPAIEDIELGYRMSAAGRKLILRPDIEVKHLKRWSLRNTLTTDFYYRALPWSDLAIRSGNMPNDLNLRISQRISVALVFLLGSLGTYLALTRGAYFLVPLFATFFILLSYYWLECSKEHCTLITSLMVLVMCVIAVLAYIAKVWLIIPMLLLAWMALFTRHRYALPLSIWHRRTGVLVGGYCLLLIAFVWIYFPHHKPGTVWLIALLTLVALNKQFYLFLAGHRGKLFALAAIPFHLLYFVSSGLAFMLALFRYQLERLHRPAGAAISKNRAKTAAR
jgi:GT2 family glycosyltransferase